MNSFANIVIYHPAAIGDAVLATPVASTLKLNYPGAKITYWSHASLKSLILGLSPAVDEFLEFDKKLGFFQLRKQLLALEPDLLVDLSNSSRGWMLPLFTKMQVLRYEKEYSDLESGQHAVGNFLETVKSVCPQLPERLFPTLYPDAIAEELVPQLVAMHQLEYGPLIGLVPGVGSLRPHRAWLLDGWIYLVQQILDCLPHMPVLLGGPEDFEIAQKIQAEYPGKVMNLCGQLKLPETAAILKCCDVVVSGDTGPAHIAVAVGTPVVGLYGPTFPRRSGPYGCAELVLDQSGTCQCLAQKHCQYSGPGAAGECMGRIMLPEVMAKIRLALSGVEGEGVPAPDDELPPPGVTFEPEVLALLKEEMAQDRTSETAGKLGQNSGINAAAVNENSPSEVENEATQL
jgi:ADP-heptose:LPS heptosyltransferase